ncbi:MAG: hypothetical protein IJF17_08510 [Thermoguttaceae bacterium]|nr:hypothetical protein [Thermoguttaceae bacterium]MDO4425005.1 hypothetical protein [Planctomycetia bacterium]
MNTENSQTAFLDFFRRLLGWRSTRVTFIPVEQRKKRSPAGMVHSPTAQSAKVKF